MTGDAGDHGRPDAPHSRPGSGHGWTWTDQSPERTLPGWLSDGSTRRTVHALALGVALGTLMVRAARR